MQSRTIFVLRDFLRSPPRVSALPGVQRAAVDHVVDATGRADDDVDAALAAAENPLVLTNVGSTDAGVARHAHVIAKGHHHLLNLEGGGEIIGCR